IPKSKVVSTDDLSISIQSFDYTLLDETSLRLVTDIAILGVYETEDNREAEGIELEQEVDGEEHYYQYDEQLTPFLEFGEQVQNDDYDLSAEARKVEDEEEEEETYPSMPVILKADETLPEWRGAQEE